MWTYIIAHVLVWENSIIINSLDSMSCFLHIHEYTYTTVARFLMKAYRRFIFLFLRHFKTFTWTEIDRISLATAACVIIMKKWNPYGFIRKYTVCERIFWINCFTAKLHYFVVVNIVREQWVPFETENVSSLGRNISTMVRCITSNEEHRQSQ